jgi:hypothetical protein
MSSRNLSDAVQIRTGLARIVIIDLTRPIIRLLDTDDFSKVRVRSGDQMDIVDRRLADAGAGWVAGDSALISICWLRDASGQVDSAEWNAGLDAMLTVAATFGWIDDTATTISVQMGD